MRRHIWNKPRKVSVYAKYIWVIWPSNSKVLIWGLYRNCSLTTNKFSARRKDSS